MERRVLCSMYVSHSRRCRPRVTVNDSQFPDVDMAHGW